MLIFMQFKSICSIILMLQSWRKKPLQIITINMLVILNLRINNGADKNSAEVNMRLSQLLQEMAGK